MTNKKFNSTGRKHRVVAFVIALAFHAVLITLLFSPKGDVADSGYLPEFVKEWFQKEDVEPKKALKNA